MKGATLKSESTIPPFTSKEQVDVSPIMPWGYTLLCRTLLEEIRK